MPTPKIVSILSLIAFTTLLACGQESEPVPESSGVKLTIQGLSLEQIDHVVVTAQPSGVSATSGASTCRRYVSYEPPLKPCRQMSSGLSSSAPRASNAASEK